MDTVGLGTATKILHTHPFLSGKKRKNTGQNVPKILKNSDNVRHRFQNGKTCNFNNFDMRNLHFYKIFSV